MNAPAIPMPMALPTLRPAEVAGYLALQYVLWFLLVWGAAAGHLTWPSLVTALFAGAMCWRAGAAWWRVAAITAVGVVCACCVDGTLGRIGVVSYAGAASASPVPPAWIIALWALFAATLALPARRLLTSPLVGAILGGIGGPVAYAGGRAMGALQVSDAGLALVGASFALTTPVIILAANRLLPVPPPPRRGRQP